MKAENKRREKQMKNDGWKIKKSSSCQREEMDVKLKLKKMTPEDLKLLEPSPKVADVSKYNLRCNRNLSEKMMKKDFVYDIRRPTQTVRKFEGHKRRSIIVSDRLRFKKHPDMMEYSMIPKNSYTGGGGDATMLSTHRTLNFKCNFCDEPIATLSSLSTHVKFHCRKYCKKCYWILDEGETIDKHFERAHRMRPKIAVNS